MDDLKEILKEAIQDAMNRVGILGESEEYDDKHALKILECLKESGYALVRLEGAGERVARAIAVADGCSPDEALIDGDRYTDEAQAAIQALTEGDNRS